MGAAQALANEHLRSKSKRVKATEQVTELMCIGLLFGRRPEQVSGRMFKCLAYASKKRRKRCGKRDFRGRGPPWRASAPAWGIGNPTNTVIGKGA